jgi:hypothetical protein
MKAKGPGHKDRAARAAIKALVKALAALPGLPSEAKALVDQAERAAAELEE